MALNLLKGEINKKKRKASEITPSTKSLGHNFVTNRDIEKAREKKYLEEQELLEAQRKAKIAKLMEIKESESDGKLGSALQLIASMLPRDEVLSRLKARGQPITFFAETDADRAERLRRLELANPIEYSEGSTNEFAKSIKEVEDEAAEEEAQAQKIGKDDPVFSVEDREPTTPEEKVLFWCRMLLAMMQQELDMRSEEMKRSSNGKRDTVTFKQTQGFLRPLMSRLMPKSQEKVPNDIFPQLLRIVESCQKGDYKDANSAYYEVAIGNAPWPMGVTMVGIHERSAREKISASSVAHVLNDETQRKYITGMKRLITFHQRRFPSLHALSVN